MTRSCGLLLLAFGAIALCGAPAFATGIDDDDTQAKSASLSYKRYQKWTIILPKEEFTPIAGKIAIPHEGGDGFAATIDGTALAIDANGDGRPDVDAKGTADNVMLKGKTKEGEPFACYLRLVNNGGTWSYATSGAMAGKIEGEHVQLIDQNNNGRYDEFGVDAMVIGRRADAASFLSRIVNLDDELYEIQVSPDGSTITYTPYTGATGTLDVLDEFESKGRLESAVVINQDGDLSFELSRAKKGLLVPAGNYRIAAGLVTKGKEQVKIRTGRSENISVQPDQQAALAWGGPIEAEFEYDRNGEKITFSPHRLWFYGKSGEEYYDWFPDGKPPKFLILDKETGRELNQAKFGGCWGGGFNEVTVSVPKDAEIEVVMKHDRDVFGGITGTPKREKVVGGTTPSGN